MMATVATFSFLRRKTASAMPSRVNSFCPFPSRTIPVIIAGPSLAHLLLPAYSMLRAVAFGSLFFAFGCSGSLPAPPSAPHASTAFIEVTYPPPPAHVEIVPARPRDDAVWADGQWTWQASNWVWQAGGWVLRPPGSTFARWEVRREADGRLFFAPGVWYGPDGREIAPPPPLVVQAIEATSGTGTTQADK